MVVWTCIRRPVCALGVILSSTSTAASFRLASSGVGHSLGARATGSSSRSVVAGSAGMVETHVVATVTVSAAAIAPLPDSERVAGELGIRSGSRCPTSQEAESIGCALGCSCGWNQQCYPRYFFTDDGETSTASFSSRRIDVGVCEAAMPILLVASVCLFVATLVCVVTLRMMLLGKFAANHGTNADPLRMPPTPCVKPPSVVAVPASASVVAAKAPLAGSPSCDSTEFKAMISEEDYCSLDDEGLGHGDSDPTIHSTCGAPSQSGASSQSLAYHENQFLEATPLPATSSSSSS